MRRVGDDDRGLGHRRHHALARALLAQIAQLALDGRVAFGLLELFFQFLQRHLLFAEPAAVLEEIIGRRDNAEQRHHRAHQLERQHLRERQQRHRVGADQSFHSVLLGPHQRHHHGAEQQQLGDALGEIGQRLLREQPLEAGERRDLGEFRRQSLGGPHQAMLHQIADQRGNGQHQEWHRQSGDQFETDLLEQSRQRRAVDVDPVGVGDQAAQRRGQAVAHAAGKGHQHQSAAGDDEPVVDFLTLDDVALQ